ncbi:hypothetical protein EK21DRAFT_112042 [Setomelanomma holmii]|uniref:Uncharacterized protein n=1 Tax=Setomelanomma holmii TaxID=210430 RepID=A0A9P4HB13_9PLEO|nr:hypothetical protein EK21DRAFT_112042 [Setomelanomma holmii]
MHCYRDENNTETVEHIIWIDLLVVLVPALLGFWLGLKCRSRWSKSLAGSPIWRVCLADAFDVAETVQELDKTSKELKVYKALFTNVRQRHVVTEDELERMSDKLKRANGDLLLDQINFDLFEERHTNMEAECETVRERFDGMLEESKLKTESHLEHIQTLEQQARDQLRQAQRHHGGEVGEMRKQLVAARELKDTAEETMWEAIAAGATLKDRANRLEAELEAMKVE